MTLLQEIRKKWKPRKRSSHKGDFGRIFILAGSRGMAGAAHLAGMGCMRAGAGLVTVAVPDAIYTVVARKESEVMVLPLDSTRQGSAAPEAFAEIMEFLESQNVFAVGPGLSHHAATQKLVRKLLARVKCPVVLDADGLNAFIGHLKELKKIKAPLILTPHPGEFSRLFGVPVGDSEADRRRKALDAAVRCKVTLVLKGHRTVVAFPNGEVYVNKTGNPGMATGGTGDVLTGVIAALLGQGFSVRDASRFGVYVHGIAGDLAKRKYGEVSLTAGDILECLPPAVKKILKR